MACRLAVAIAALLLPTHAAVSSVDEFREVERAFIGAVNDAPAGTRSVVFDVGANDGGWSGQWRNGLVAAKRKIRVIMLEPQPQFNRHLSTTAERFNFTFIAAAASKSDGHKLFTTFNKSRSVSASFSSGKPPPSEKTHKHICAWPLRCLIIPVGRAGKPSVDMGETVMVKTVNLAELLKSHITADTVSLMKLDVEGYEFELLPWLFGQGALCLLDYLIVEWHINSVEPSQRLSALGFRLSFYSMLRHGCEKPPVAVFMEDYIPNNYAVAVPGLFRVAMEHTSWSGPTRGGVRLSSITSRFEKKDAAFFKDTTQESLDEKHAHAPQCHGSCFYEELSLNLSATHAAYKLMQQNKVPVVKDGLVKLNRASSQSTPKVAWLLTSSSDLICQEYEHYPAYSNRENA